jgi:hypothetical protein
MGTTNIMKGHPGVSLDALFSLPETVPPRALHLADYIIFTAQTSSTDCDSLSVAWAWQSLVTRRIRYSEPISADNRRPNIDACGLFSNGIGDPPAVAGLAIAGQDLDDVYTPLNGTIQIAVISGTLAQWRDAVKSGSEPATELPVRQCFNKVYLLLRAADLNVWPTSAPSLRRTRPSAWKTSKSLEPAQTSTTICDSLSGRRCRNEPGNLKSNETGAKPRRGLRLS